GMVAASPRVAEREASVPATLADARGATDHRRRRAAIVVRVEQHTLAAVHPKREPTRQAKLDVRLEIPPPRDLPLACDAVVDGLRRGGVRTRGDRESEADRDPSPERKAKARHERRRRAVGRDAAA